MYYLIASHGSIASGVVEAIKILTGNTKNVLCYDAYLDNSNPENELDTLLDSIPEKEKTITFSGMFGGSVNTYLTQRLNENRFLIAGANLSCILELMSMPEESINRESIDEVVELSRTFLTQVTLDELTAVNENEEDFFD